MSRCINGTADVGCCSPLNLIFFGRCSSSSDSCSSSSTKFARKPCKNNGRVTNNGKLVLPSHNHTITQSPHLYKLPIDAVFTLNVLQSNAPMQTAHRQSRRSDERPVGIAGVSTVKTW